MPESVSRLTAAGHHLLVETSAGAGAYVDDRAYAAAGAEVVPDAETLYQQADLVLKVGPPFRADDGIHDEVALLREGIILIGVLSPLRFPALMGRLAERGVSAFSLDALPRITRAQSMDVLSSMSTIAGYRAALIGATELGRFFPLLMTAGGTVTPARVLILGAGVAGLQAIATARRLGAVVEAFDTRPAAGEQVESLGARFLTLPLEHKDAEDAGGYARALSEETAGHERALLAQHVREADVIISTAMVPGAPAPVLVTEEMVASMRSGSVIVDLAAEAGGNCVLTQAGQRVVAHGVTILGPMNLPSSLPVHASQLYSRNLVTYVQHLLAKGFSSAQEAGAPQLTLDDEIVISTCITHGGQILHQPTRQRYEALSRVITR
jgi:NAD(P) transhydrogenase subunit alpha